MKLGLLWYDADPKRPPERKIDDAAERYRLKFGVLPNTCYVNPRESVRHATLKIVAKPIVHANHYLVGVAEVAAEVTLPDVLVAANFGVANSKAAVAGDRPKKRARVLKSH